MKLSFIFLLTLFFVACNLNKITSNEGDFEIVEETKDGCKNAYILASFSKCKMNLLSIVKDTCTNNPIGAQSENVYLIKTYTPKLQTVERIENYLAESKYCANYFRTYRGYKTKSDGDIINVTLVSRKFVQNNPKTWFYLSPEVFEPYKVTNIKKKIEGGTFYFNKMGEKLDTDEISIKIARSAL